MSEFTWHAGLEIGIPFIDDQHEELFTRLNRLYDMCEDGAPLPGLEAEVASLRAYLVSHFRSEEQLHRRYGFPQWLLHERAHEAFLRRLDHLCEDVRSNGPSRTSTTVFAEILIRWLIRHIEIDDKDFGAYLTENGFRREVERLIG